MLNEKGFSITEVLIAIVILSVVSLSLYFALSAGSNTSNKNTIRLLASKLADEKMIFLKHNKKEIISKIKYKTIPSLKEKISEEKVTWKINQRRTIDFTRIIELKIENNSPLLIHTWITMIWQENKKEKKIILESYL